MILRCNSNDSVVVAIELLMAFDDSLFQVFGGGLCKVVKKKLHCVYASIPVVLGYPIQVTCIGAARHARMSRLNALAHPH
jgi:hypothetical protein